MVDFRARLKVKAIEKKTDPLAIYETLDRESDKGPLRPAQDAILTEWSANYRAKKDAIIKLHTGQGKTLIGLLALQSKINEKPGPALYICPNKYLVKQTCIQAGQFGLKYVEMDKEIPSELIDGDTIIITHVQKVFNGLTKLKLGPRAQRISYLVMDDAHACIESIKRAFNITVKNTEQTYHDIVNLFQTELEFQGAGTFAEIKMKDFDSFLGIPYWDWQEKHLEVVQILSKALGDDNVKFAWPLIKDIIKDCQCIVSGDRLEIFPHVPPLNLFESFTKASHRIFMSATFTEDSFLIKGLGVSADAVKAPLTYKNEKWSGEKMIVIPSIVEPTLDRSEIVNSFGGQKVSKFGIVVLSPSFKACRDWETCGARVANTDNIEEEIHSFKKKEFENVLVIVNRYDGIDLPDQTCRIMIFDSKPYAEELYDRYVEACRGSSEITSKKSAQRIEQGLGRAVRGEKDYCAILLIGPELINAVRSKESRRFFSVQTRTQIEIGIQVSEWAKDDLKEGKKPILVLGDLINKLIKRDEGWKEFYSDKMTQMPTEDNGEKILTMIELEKKADDLFLDGEFQRCAEQIQALIDSCSLNSEDKGWYLQEIARVTYPVSKVDSNKFQISAHKTNTFLFKPKAGMQIVKLATIHQRRNETLINWIKGFASFQELQLRVDEILGNLVFGVKADKFEKAVDDLAKCLGFDGQRPDKEWKEGPDNLWLLRDNEYLLIECKNGVILDRAEIYKDETGQLNNALAWFRKNYNQAPVTCLMIIPTLKVGSAAGFNGDVTIVRDKNLKKLVKNVRSFFSEFRDLDFQSLSEVKVQRFLEAHNLSIDNLKTTYSEVPKMR